MAYDTTHLSVFAMTLTGWGDMLREAAKKIKELEATIAELEAAIIKGKE